MDLHSEEDMTFTYSTKRHPTQILTQTLAGLTVHRVDTVMVAPSPKHSWQDRINLHLTKLKLSMKQRKNDAGYEFVSAHSSLM